MELDSAVTKVFGAYGVDDDPDGQDIPIDELIGSVNGWSVGIGCYGRLLVVENPAAGRRWSGVITKDSEGLFCKHDGTRLPLDPPCTFFAWTKSRVYFLEETEYGCWFVNSVPRNPVSLLG